jgi:hypothetical protein
MLKKVSSEWSHQGLSGHPLTTKVMLPPAREHSFHFSTSRPKVLQNGSHGHYWEPFGSPNAPKASPSHHLSHHPRGWKWRDNGVTMAWQWRDNGVTMTWGTRGWQWRDNGVTMASQWRDKEVTRRWQGGSPQFCRKCIKKCNYASPCAPYCPCLGHWLDTIIGQTLDISGHKGWFHIMSHNEHTSPYNIPCRRVILCYAILYGMVLCSITCLYNKNRSHVLMYKQMIMHIYIYT